MTRQLNYGSSLILPGTTDDAVTRFIAAVQLIHGPISEDCLAIDVALVHRPKIAAVVRHGAMIAENEEAVGRDDDLAIRASIRVIAGNIVFVQRFPVHVDQPIFNADAVAGNSYDALDVALRSVARIAEDDNIATLDGFPAIDKLVDEDPFLVFEPGIMLVPSTFTG